MGDGWRERSSVWLLATALAACGTQDEVAPTPQPTEPGESQTEAAPEPAPEAAPELPSDEETARGRAACEEGCDGDARCVDHCMGSVSRPCGDDPRGFAVRYGDRCYTGDAFQVCIAVCGAAEDCRLGDEAATPRVLHECVATEEL